MSSEGSVECCDEPFPPGTDDCNIDDNIDSVQLPPVFGLFLNNALESSMPISDNPLPPITPRFRLPEPAFEPPKLLGGGTE